MKQTIETLVKRIVADRPFMALLVFFLIACFAYCFYVSLSIHPSDLQLAVHYTAFGETGYYREKWYYLLSFIFFGLVMAVVHTMIAAKLYQEDRRQFAVGFMWLSLIFLVIAWILTWSILKIAAF